MSSYRDLEIFTLAKELAIKIHKVTLVLPKHEQLGRKLNKYIQWVEDNWNTNP
jgi:hypothetical protein